MKFVTTPQITDVNNILSTELLKQIQNIADDMIMISKGGLNFSDKQLPFQYREVQVVSGQPFILVMPSPYTLRGCIPILTFGNTVTSFSTDISNNRFTMTLNLQPPAGQLVTNPYTTKIGLLMIGV